MADLSKICIRAQVDGKWESPTLKELIDTGRAGTAYEWALERLNRLDEVMLTEDNLSDFVDVIEKLGVGVAKLK